MVLGQTEVSVTVFKFAPTRYYNTIGSHPPILEIKSGDAVETTTVDAAGMDGAGQQAAPPVNPLTGPFFITDAEPGDTLAVYFDRIWPNRTTGYSGSIVAEGTVDPAFVRALPERARAHWRLDLDRGLAVIEEPGPELEQLSLAFEPMLGCFGVAPPLGQAISTVTSSTHGGNMDYRGFRQGVTVYLPVFVPGALFYLGDGHARQGDGELVGTGIETSCDVTFTVRLVKGKRIQWPRAEDDDYIMTVGNARPLDQALQHATTELMQWLIEEHGHSMRSASLLLGQCIRYEVANVIDPAYTMVAKVEKRYLARSGNRGLAGSPPGWS